ncbi:hypothetical protein PAXINDRAFT_168204 [Paxillus involutus ATCC 200175]|nr:hypothetical protein PAXINDRAFT_168204 [Paxillus involutus ATCC 200175]
MDAIHESKLLVEIGIATFRIGESFMVQCVFSWITTLFWRFLKTFAFLFGGVDAQTALKQRGLPMIEPRMRIELEITEPQNEIRVYPRTGRAMHGDRSMKTFRQAVPRIVDN